MIPLSALIRRNNTPGMTVLLIALNVVCFLWMDVGLSPRLRHLYEAQYALVPSHFHFSSLLTSMFMHGGWLHLIGNMWFLWVFGSHIEDVMGAARFLLFYVCCGIAAGLVQLAVSIGSPVQVLGASGAIAGVMGAFMVLYPRVRVRTLIFIIFFVTVVEIPAAFMLLYWFVIQLFSGVASEGRFAGADSGGIAWFAHVGGFLTGLLLIRLFPNTRRYFY